MEDSNGDEGGDVKPDRHVHVALPPLEDGPNHVDAKDHPDDGDGNVDGPLQLCIFLAGGITQRQTDGSGQYDALPAPEVYLAEQVTVHARLEQALHRVVNPCKARIAHKGKNHCIGMQRADAAKGGEGKVEVEGRVK